MNYDLIDYAKEFLTIREDGKIRKLNPSEVGQIKTIQQAMENREKLQLVKFEGGGFLFIKAGS